MEPLCIRDALELHRVIAPHLPQVEVDAPALEFARHLVGNMRASDPSSYLVAVKLLTGLSTVELQEKTSIDILELFLEGLAINQLLSLDKFVKGLGLKYG